MEQDFWLVFEPKFLEKFPNISKQLKRTPSRLSPWTAPGSGKVTKSGSFRHHCKLE
jgi:hypothetical protein